jgi:hypothetical protein
MVPSACEGGNAVEPRALATLSRIVRLAIIAAHITACANEPTTPAGPTPTSIRLQPQDFQIIQNGSGFLTAAVLDESGAAIPRAAINLVSDDTSLVQVRLDGFATAGTRTGTTRIHASALGLTASVQVIVNPRIATMQFQPLPDPLYQLDSAQLRVVIRDVAGQPVTSAELTYASTEPEFVTVSATGMLRTVGPPGHSTIHVQADLQGVRLAKAIGVTSWPRYHELVVPTTPVIVGTGGSAQIPFALLDRQGTPVEHPVISFTSEDPSVLGTTQNGVAYSVGAAGTTRVRVQADTLVRIVTINVTPLPRRDWNVVASTSSGEAVSVAAGASGVWIASNGLRGSWKTLTMLPHVSFSSAYGVALNGTSTTAYFTADPYGLAVVDMQSGTKAWEPDTIYALTTRAIAVIPNTRLVALVAEPDLLVAIDTATREAAWHVQTASTEAQHISFHPTSPLLYLNGTNGIVTEVNLLTRIQRTLNVGGVLGGVAVSADGSRLYVIRQHTPRLLEYDRATLAFLREVVLDGPCYSVAASTDGRELYVTCLDTRDVVIVDLTAMSIRKRICVSGESIGRLVVSPDGTTLMVAHRFGVALLR